MEKSLEKAVTVLDPRAKNWRLWLWLKAHGNRFTAFLAALASLLTLIDIVYSSKSVHERTLESTTHEIIFVIGFCNGTLTQLFFAAHLNTVHKQFITLKQVAGSLETGNQEDKDLVVTARRMRVLFYTIHGYALLQLVGAVLPPLLTCIPYIRMYPEPTSFTAFFVMWIYQSLALLFGLCSMFSFTALVVCSCLGAGALFRTLGQRMREIGPSPGPRLRELIHIHQNLSQCSSNLEKTYATTMSFVMLNLTSIALLCSFNALNKSVDSFVAAAGIAHTTVFVMMSMVGESLSGASVEFGEHVYFGSWEINNNADRRLQFMVMLRSSRAVNLRARGLGTLSHRGCLDVFRSWYSWMQALSKLR